MSQHTGEVGESLRAHLLWHKENHPQGRGLTTAMDLACRMMGLAAWQDREVSPVLHYSFAFLFMFCISFERFALGNPERYGVAGKRPQTIQQHVNEDIRHIIQIKILNQSPVSKNSIKGVKV